MISKTKTKRVAIYTRLSVDPTGQAESPDNHVKACRQFIERNGWEVAGEPFIDRDISGWRNKKRPAFNEMLAGIEAKQFDAVCVFELSRFSRNLTLAWPWVGRIVDAGAQLVSVSDNIDTSNALGRGILALQLSSAEKQSEDTSKRVKLAIEMKAAKGLPNHGRRCFGYTAQFEQIPSEVKEAKRIVKQILNGGTLSGIAKDLNARGITTTAGGQWTGSSLRKWASTPSLAGIRLHRATGTEVQGTWKPIITAEQRDALLVRLGDRHVSKGLAPNQVRWLLSGIALCGHCGTPMHAHPGSRRYTCSATDGRGCGRMAASVDRCDEVVRDQLLGYLVRGQIGPSATPTVDHAAVVADLQSQLESLNRARFVDNAIGQDEWKPLRDELQARLVAAEEAQTAHEAETHSLPTGKSLPELVAWWEASTVDQQRTAIRDAVYSVTINPPSKQGCQFDPNRVVMNWRVGSGAFLRIVANEDWTPTAEDIAQQAADQELGWSDAAGR